MSYLTQLLSELLKGAMLAIGFFACFVFIVTKIYTLYKNRKNKDQYEASNLLEPFRTYLQKAHREEWFEQIKEIESIIQTLEKGNIPSVVALYKIKTDPEIYLESISEGKTVIKVGKKYEIVNRIIDISIKPQTEHND